MPKVKKEVAEVAEKETKVTKKTEEVKEIGVYSGNTLVRVYSKADHGADYAELAKMFALKKNYTLK